MTRAEIVPARSGAQAGWLSVLGQWPVMMCASLLMLAGAVGRLPRVTVPGDIGQAVERRGGSESPLAYDWHYYESLADQARARQAAKPLSSSDRAVMSETGLLVLPDHSAPAPTAPAASSWKDSLAAVPPPPVPAPARAAPANYEVGLNGPNVRHLLHGSSFGSSFGQIASPGGFGAGSLSGSGFGGGFAGGAAAAPLAAPLTPPAPRAASSPVAAASSGGLSSGDMRLVRALLSALRAGAGARAAAADGVAASGGVRSPASAGGARAFGGLRMGGAAGAGGVVRSGVVAAYGGGAGSAAAFGGAPTSGLGVPRPQPIVVRRVGGLDGGLVGSGSGAVPLPRPQPILSPGGHWSVLNRLAIMNQDLKPTPGLKNLDTASATQAHEWDTNPLRPASALPAPTVSDKATSSLVPDSVQVPAVAAGTSVPQPGPGQNATPWQGLVDAATKLMTVAGMLLMVSALMVWVGKKLLGNPFTAAIGQALIMSGMVMAYAAAGMAAAVAAIGTAILMHGQIIQGLIFTLSGGAMAFAAMKAAQGDRTAYKDAKAEEAAIDAARQAQAAQVMGSPTLPGAPAGSAVSPQPLGLSTVQDPTTLQIPQQPLQSVGDLPTSPVSGPAPLPTLQDPTLSQVIPPQPSQLMSNLPTISTPGNLSLPPVQDPGLSDLIPPEQPQTLGDLPVSSLGDNPPPAPDLSGLTSQDQLPSLGADSSPQVLGPSQPVSAVQTGVHEVTFTYPDGSQQVFSGPNIPTACNNPGNITLSNSQIAVLNSGGALPNGAIGYYTGSGPSAGLNFAIFPDAQTGASALSGYLGNLPSNLTLQSLFTNRFPGYLSTALNALGGGVSGATQVGALSTGQMGVLQQVITKVEGIVPGGAVPVP